MTLRIPYTRFAWIGLVFSLLIAVLIISSNVLLREANASAAAHEYLIAVSALFSTWILNLIGLRLFESRQDKRVASRQRIFFSFVLIIGLSLLFHYLFDFSRPPPPPRGALPNTIPAAHVSPEWVKLAYGLITGIALNTLVLFALEVLMLRNTKTTIETENAKLRAENLEAVNLMLKQQIQPHFLFNSLNTLKSLMRRDTDNAEAYLVKLSDFLRGSISTQGSTTVIVSEELTLCSNYLDLQAMRFGDALRYEFNVSESSKSKGQVPPFSIQLLIENAIKHNQLTEDLPLTIKVEEDDGWIAVSNNLQLRTTKEESTGIGLANLRARYASLSSEEILIEQADNTFIVKIKIL